MIYYDLNWTEKHEFMTNSDKTQAIKISNKGQFDTENVDKILIRNSPVE
jgi:hypothetical protein